MANEGNPNLMALSAAMLLAKIMIVDGVGSGLDADLVRGATPGTAGINLLSKSTIGVGSLMYGGASNSISELSIGSANTVLTSTGSAPQWSTNLDLTGTIRSKSAAAGIQLDNNAATGNFTLSLSPANLTAGRRWTFPDANDTVAGLAQAQTFSASNTFSAVTAVSNTTSASTPTTGSLVIGNGTTATTVAIGAGQIYAGSTIRGTGLSASVSSPAFLAGNNQIFTMLDAAGGLTNCSFFWCDTSNNFNFGVRNNTAMRIATGTPTDSISGLLVIGDTVTTATNVSVGGGKIFSGSDITAGGVFKVGANQVVGARVTGYGTPTGGANQGSFAAGSITLPNLAAGVAQLILDLKTHGLLGT